MIAGPGEFQVFVKPVGAQCNLRCSYCYYIDKKELYLDQVKVIMSDDILEKYVVQHISANTNNVIFFSWHGGEPLMAGLDFYKKAVALQYKHKPIGCEIINGIQTNGTLLNDEWCRFLKSEKFIVGISIDGPQRFHNSSRYYKDGKGSFIHALRGFKLLMKYGITPEILCVVNSENVLYPLEVYRFFRNLGAIFMTFLPLVEPDKNSDSGVSLRSVPSKDFGVFLSEIFDEWLENDIGKIKVQIFEEAARTAFGQDHTLCIFKTECGGVPVVEHNGDFFCCDHFVDRVHLLGNIASKSLAELLDDERQVEFGNAKLSTLPKYCLNCEVRDMCNGECPKNRIIKTPDGQPGLNYLCEGYKYFFNHCRPFVDAIAEMWKSQQ